MHLETLKLILALVAGLFGKAKAFLDGTQDAPRPEHSLRFRNQWVLSHYMWLEGYDSLIDQDVYDFVRAMVPVKNGWTQDGFVQFVGRAIIQMFEGEEPSAALAWSGLDAFDNAFWEGHIGRISYDPDGYGGVEATYEDAELEDTYGDLDDQLGSHCSKDLGGEKTRRLILEHKLKSLCDLTGLGAWAKKAPSHMLMLDVADSHGDQIVSFRRCFLWKLMKNGRKGEEHLVYDLCSPRTTVSSVTDRILHFTGIWTLGQEAVRKDLLSLEKRLKRNGGGLPRDAWIQLQDLNREFGLRVEKLQAIVPLGVLTVEDMAELLALRQVLGHEHEASIQDHLLLSSKGGWEFPFVTNAYRDTNRRCSRDHEDALNNRDHGYDGNEEGVVQVDRNPDIGRISILDPTLTADGKWTGPRLVRLKHDLVTESDPRIVSSRPLTWEDWAVIHGDTRLFMHRPRKPIIMLERGQVVVREFEKDETFPRAVVTPTLSNGDVGSWVKDHVFREDFKMTPSLYLSMKGTPLLKVYVPVPWGLLKKSLWPGKSDLVLLVEESERYEGPQYDFRGWALEVVIYGDESALKSLSGWSDRAWNERSDLALKDWVRSNTGLTWKAACDLVEKDPLATVRKIKEEKSLTTGAAPEFRLNTLKKVDKKDVVHRIAEVCMMAEEEADGLYSENPRLAISFCECLLNWDAPKEGCRFWGPLTMGLKREKREISTERESLPEDLPEYIP